MNIHYFVNDKSRLCRVITPDHVGAALKDGFREVTSQQMDEFQEQTRLMKDAGSKRKA